MFLPGAEGVCEDAEHWLCLTRCLSPIKIHWPVQTPLTVQTWLQGRELRDLGGMSPAPAHACLQLSPAPGKSVPGQSCSLSSQLLCTSEHHWFMDLGDIHKFPRIKPSWRPSNGCSMTVGCMEGLIALCGLCSFFISWCPEISKLFHGLASPSATSEQEVPVHESRGQRAAGIA